MTEFQDIPQEVKKLLTESLQHKKSEEGNYEITPMLVDPSDFKLSFGILEKGNKDIWKLKYKLSLYKI